MQPKWQQSGRRWAARGSVPQVQRKSFEGNLEMEHEWRFGPFVGIYFNSSWDTLRLERKLEEVVTIWGDLSDFNNIYYLIE